MLTFIQYLEEKNKPTTLSQRDLVKHVTSRGWSLKRSKGGHDIYFHPNSREHLSIPRHAGDLSPGVVDKTLKTANAVSV